MLCKFHSIVLYTVHDTAFCLGVGRFSDHGVYALCLYNVTRLHAYFQDEMKNSLLCSVSGRAMKPSVVPLSLLTPKTWTSPLVFPDNSRAFWLLWKRNLLSVGGVISVKSISLKLKVTLSHTRCGPFSFWTWLNPCAYFTQTSQCVVHQYPTTTYYWQWC